MTRVEFRPVSAAVRRGGSPLLESYRRLAQGSAKEKAAPGDVSDEEVGPLIELLEGQMRRAASELDFERAAALRDEIQALRKAAAKRGVPVPQA